MYKLNSLPLWSDLYTHESTIKKILLNPKQIIFHIFVCFDTRIKDAPKRRSWEDPENGGEEEEDDELSEPQKG